MIILFLDIDGVLIPSSRYIHNRMAGIELDFDPTCIAFLKRVLESDREIVIVTNSTHNSNPHLFDKLKDHLTYDRILGKTEYPEIGDRVEAGEKFIQDYGVKPDKKVYIDDAILDLPKNEFIHCDPSVGFSINEYNKLAHILQIKKFIVLI